MKRQWRTRRQLVEARDAQRRWDRAYQCLLRWSRCVSQERTVESVTCYPAAQEVCDENRRVRTRINSTSGRGPDD